MSEQDSPMYKKEEKKRRGKRAGGGAKHLLIQPLGG